MSLCAVESQGIISLMQHPPDSTWGYQSERRRHRRFRVPGAYCTGSCCAAMQLCDLSLGGMSFLSAADWQRQPKTSFNLFLGGDSFAVRDINCRQVSCLAIDGSYRIGLQFTDLSPKQQYHLAHFLLAYSMPPSSLTGKR